MLDQIVNPFFEQRLFIGGQFIVKLAVYEHGASGENVPGFQNAALDFPESGPLDGRIRVFLAIHDLGFQSIIDFSHGHHDRIRA